MTLDARGALRRRVESLDRGPRRVLLLLAVAGVPVDDAHLRDAASDGDRFDAAVAALERRGLAVRDGTHWHASHDEHVTAVIDAAPESEVRAAAAAVGRALSDADARDARSTRLAARLLHRGGESAALTRLFTRVVRQLRLDGDGRSDRALARELLGDSATAPDSDALARSLPVLVRARLVSLRRVAAAVAVVLLAPLSVAAAVRLATRPAPRAEVVLSLLRRDARSGRSDVTPAAVTAVDMASAAPIVVAPRGRSWPLPDSAMRFVQGRSDLRTDGRGWVMPRAVSGGGVLDLFDVRLDGSLRRLTFAAKDDIEPSWAPDGAAIVYSTMQWTTHGHYDLAVLDVRSKRVRRLTGPDSDTDEGARWSPDGSRIAFVRHHAVEHDPALCVVDVDGSHERCTPPSAAFSALLGWIDERRVALLLYEGDRVGLHARAVETGDDRVLRDDPRGTEYSLSPDGAYVWCRCRRPGYPNGTSFLFAVDLPTELRPIELRDGAVVASGIGVWAPTTPRRPSVDTLRILGGRGAPLVGTTYQLRVAGRDTAGRDVAVGAVRWRSLDTAAATIDSAGRLLARRAGLVVVEASAGGWRRATAQLTAVASHAGLLLDERWAGDVGPAWTPFGEPRPSIVRGTPLGAAFTTNGDGSFYSGAWSARAFDARGGLWIETTISLPLTRPGPSQEQLLSLFAARDSARFWSWDRRTGDLNDLRACTVRAPTSADARHTGDSVLSFAGDVSHTAAAPGGAYRNGRPLRVVLQLLPDGRCAFAVDGQTVFVGPPTFFAPAARVLLQGNSQETRVLVGPLRVYAGVASVFASEVRGVPAPTARAPVSRRLTLRR